jgi:hypothetical protein
MMVFHWHSQQLKERGMRAFLAVLVVAALAGPALAQDNHIQRYGEPDHEQTATEKAADKAAARAYEKSLNVIPDAGASDPWGGVRSTDAPKATTAKPKKTKSSAEAK